MAAFCGFGTVTSSFPSALLNFNLSFIRDPFWVFFFLFSCLQVPFLHYCTGFYFSFGFPDNSAFAACLVFFLGTCFIEPCSLFLDVLPVFHSLFGSFDGG